MVSEAIDDHWALGRLGHWVQVALSRQALGRRGTGSSGTQTQQHLLYIWLDIRQRYFCFVNFIIALNKE